MSAQNEDTLVVAGRTFRSRLIIGTGKYADYQQNADALDASGADIVTVAVRRVNLSDPTAPMLADFIDPEKMTYLPNTAGCFTGEDAVRTLRLAREAGGWDLGEAGSAVRSQTSLSRYGRNAAGDEAA